LIRILAYTNILIKQSMKPGDHIMSIERIVLAFAGAMILVSLTLSQLHLPVFAHWQNCLKNWGKNRAEHFNC